jgi:hypothetical protein
MAEPLVKTWRERTIGILRQEKLRGMLAFFGSFCVPIALTFMTTNHLFWGFLLLSLGPAWAIFVFWPELKRLRITYNERTRTESPMWLYLFALASCLSIGLAWYLFYVSIEHAPTVLTPQEFAEPLVEHKYFHIADFADIHHVIADRDFEDCWIYGPAVLAGDKNTDVGWGSADSSFAEVFAAITIPVPLAGVIYLKDCKFRRCHFVGVTFLGTPNMVQQWHENNYGSGTAHPAQSPPSE